jgi:hypothetical protein
MQSSSAFSAIARRLKRLPAAVAAFFLASAAPVLAQDDPFGLQTTVGKVKQRGAFYTSLEGIIGQVVTVVLGLVGIVFFLMMLYAGFLWMTARGAQDQVKKAKDMIAAAIIGLMLVVSAYAIATFVITNLAKGGPSAQSTPSGGVGEGGACQTDADCQGLLECGADKKCASPLGGGDSSTKKATGAVCTAGTECVSGTCQPPTCDQEGTDCTTNADCPNAASGEVCSRRCQ